MSGRGILLAVAIIIAVFTVISIRSSMEQAPEVAQAQKPRIVYAKRDLALGTFVQGEQDLEFADAPEQVAVTVEQPQEDAQANEVQVSASQNAPWLYENAVQLSDFNGAVVRRNLRAGEPVPQSALMKAGEGGFMSAVLEPGMRAVSIAVNATTGNAGFVSPGDRVDLIVTHRFKTGVGMGGNDESVVSETFVRDLRVVAVDQMLDNPENKAILAKTITVECSSQEAEQIAVATEMGKISLALRSLSPAQQKTAEKEEGGEVALTNEGPEAEALRELYGAGGANAAPVPADKGYTRDSDLSHLLERRALVVPRVQVLRGDKSETIDFTQGAQ